MTVRLGSYLPAGQRRLSSSNRFRTRTIPVTGSGFLSSSFTIRKCRPSEGDIPTCKRTRSPVSGLLEQKSGLAVDEGHACSNVHDPDLILLILRR